MTAFNNELCSKLFFALYNLSWQSSKLVLHCNFCIFFCVLVKWVLVYWKCKVFLGEYFWIIDKYIRWFFWQKFSYPSNFLDWLKTSISIGESWPIMQPLIQRKVFQICLCIGVFSIGQISPIQILLFKKSWKFKGVRKFLSKNNLINLSMISFLIQIPGNIKF